MNTSLLAYARKSAIHKWRRKWDRPDWVESFALKLKLKLKSKLKLKLKLKSKPNLNLLKLKEKQQKFSSGQPEAQSALSKWPLMVSRGF